MSEPDEPRRKRRRVTRPADGDADPRPSESGFDEAWAVAPDVDTDGGANGNDERLKQDRPPHWG